MNALRIPAALILLGLASAALADGDCERRPLSAAEKQFVSARAAAVRKALPAAPAGWQSYRPADAGLDTVPDETPADTCREGGPYPLLVLSSSYFTPKDSALARQAEAGRQLAELRRDGRKQARKSAASSGASSAEAGDQAGEMMQLQQQLMAAQASGDMAAMQALIARLQKSGEAMTQSMQQINDQGNADASRTARLYEADQQQSQKLDSLAAAAAAARRVSVVVEINPRNLAARPSSARRLQLPGAAQAWVGSEPVFCPAHGDGSKLQAIEAVALVGAVTAGWDNGEAQSYEPQAPVSIAATQRSAMVRVCGDAGMVEPVLRAVQLDALGN